MKISWHRGWVTGIRMSAQSERAFTLTELMVSVAVTSVVLAGVSLSMLLLGRTQLVLQSRSDLQGRNQFAASILSRDIREATRIEVGGDAQFTLTTQDGMQVTYAWDSVGRTWARSTAGLNSTLLRGCTNFAIAFYARPPTNGSVPFGTLSTCDASTSGVVEATWTCVRTNGSLAGNVVESFRTGRLERRNR